MKLQITIALSLVVAIVLTNLLALAFTDNTYKTYFKDTEKIHYALNVINYLRVGTPLDATYFSAQAISHMQDVRGLTEGTKIANAIALFILFASSLYLGHKKKLIQLKSGLIFGLILLTLIILFIFIAAIINFNYTFIAFHEIAFRNNDWLFAPGDTLVVLFSTNFFVFFIQKLITNILLTILALLILIKFIPKHGPKNN